MPTAKPKTQRTDSPSTTRAAIYLRQSQDRSGQEEGIERQRSRCTSLAELRGWTVVEEYVDNDTSATKPRGPGTAWHRLMDDARAGKIDMIIAVDMDRLLRTLNDLVALTNAGAKVVTVDGEVDLGTADGEFRATMAAGLARFEGRRKAERMRRANADRRTRGIPTSGRVPYGYEWVPTRDRTTAEPSAYTVDAERAKDVRFIFDSFLAGVPLGSICRDLNEQGKRTIGIKAHPDGVVFRPTTVRRMLASPYYAALLPVPAPDGGRYDQSAIVRADCEEGNWPAIVTVEEWEEARTRLSHPERRTSPGPSRKYLLSGLALCGICDEPIRAGGGEAGIHSYRCRGMAHFMRRGVPLDDFISRVIVARLSQPDAAALLTPSGGRGDVEELRAERRRLQLKITEASDDEQDGLISRPEMVRKIKRANLRVAEIDALTQATVNTDALRDLVGAADVAAAWKGASLGHKRAVLDSLMTVHVHSVGQGNRRNMSDEAMAKTLTITWREQGSDTP